MSFANKVGYTIYVLGMYELSLQAQNNVTNSASNLSNRANTSLSDLIDYAETVLIFDFDNRLVYFKIKNEHECFLNYYKISFASFWSFLSPRNSDTYESLITEFGILQTKYQSQQILKYPVWEREGF